MNAKEYDMMIFIGAGQGFPGSLSDHKLSGNSVCEIFWRDWKTKAIKD